MMMAVVVSSPLPSAVGLMLVIWIITSSEIVVDALLHVRKDPNDNNTKSLQICTLAGGLDAVRLASVPIRQVFEEALKDVELIRHHVVESAHIRGDRARPVMSLEELSQTLDWEARNMSRSDTTLDAGIGYSDDRSNRTIERLVSMRNEPFVGNKTTDLALIESAATILPWLMDRTMIHHNGTGTNDDDHHHQTTIYNAAWIGSYGDAWVYYPTCNTEEGKAYNLGDLSGGNCSSHAQAFVQPNLPPAVIDKPYLTAPYSDLVTLGDMVITAQAPVYFQGSFMGNQYFNSLEGGDDPDSTTSSGRTPLGTYVASTGVDISTASISSVLLDNLKGTITPGSFAMAVGANEELNTVLISQSSLEKIYPTHTGMEETRVIEVSSCNINFSTDRRNQTYQVSDTLAQPLTQLANADWAHLADLVQQLQPGDRSFTTLPITLRGQESPTSFHVFFERWPDVADWATLLLVPEEELDNSVVVNVVEPQQGDSLFVTMNAAEADIEEDTSTTATTTNATKTRLVLENSGRLDVRIEIDKIPPWLSLDQEILMWSLPAGQNLALAFDVNIRQISSAGGGYSGVIALKVHDGNEQNNCYYEDILTINTHLTVVRLETLQSVRPYGLALSAVIVLSALGWSIWVIRNGSHIVIRASQPMFLHMICIGILFMGLSLIPLSMDDSLLVGEGGCNKACMAFPWLLCLGFSISFSALFSKVRRINMIVANTKQYRRVTVEVGDVMVPFIVICSLNVTLLQIWTSLDPLVWVRDTGISSAEDTDHQGGLVASTGYCSFGEGRIAIACALMLLLVNFVAVFLSLIQLYRARELSATYSEGKYIAMAMGSIMQAFLSGIPVLAMVTDNPQVAYLVKSTIVFVVTMSLLTLTFLPKYFARRQDQGIRPVSSKANHHLSSSSSSNDNDVPAGTKKSDIEGADAQQTEDTLPASGGKQSISEISMPTFVSNKSHRSDLEDDSPPDDPKDTSSSPPKYRTRHGSSWTLPTVRETFVDEEDKEDERSCVGVREIGVDAPPTRPMRLKSQVEVEFGRPPSSSTKEKEIGPQPPAAKPERVLSCLEILPEEGHDEHTRRVRNGEDKHGIPPPTSHVTTRSEFSTVSSIYTMPEMYHNRRLYPNLDNIQ